MRSRRTKPPRGGPTAGSPMGIEWPDPNPLEAPGGPFPLTERSSRGRVDVALQRAGAAPQRVPPPPLEGGRSWLGLRHPGSTDRGLTSLLPGHELSKVKLGSGTVEI